MKQVEQGWIASEDPDGSFSEAVVVYYNPEVISVRDLTTIHLHTHKSTSNHSMRSKYRSAVYYFDEPQKILIKQVLVELQSDFSEKIITKILPFKDFKCSPPQYQNYYQQDPEKPFCRTYITPKLAYIFKKYKHFKEG